MLQETLPAVNSTASFTGTNVYVSGSGSIQSKSGSANVTWQYKSARTVTRDKNRFRFAALAGYMQPFAYSVSESQLTLNVAPTRFSGRAATSNASVSWSSYYPLLINIGLTGAGWGITGNWWSNQVSSLRSSAIAGCNSDVRSTYVNAVEAGRELKKTANMILGVVKTVGKAALQVKRGQFLGAAKTLGVASPNKKTLARMNARYRNDLKRSGKSRLTSEREDLFLDYRGTRGFASNWLEFRYGWGPLYYTVYGEMVRQYELAKTKSKVRRASAKRKVSSLGNNLGANGPYSTQADASGAGLYQQYYVDNKEDRSVELTQVWYFEVTSTAYQSTQSIGLTNPAAVAWELVPLSFVVDWFVNVGDVLESLDTWLGKRFITGTETIIYRSTLRRSGRKGALSSGWVQTDWSPGSTSFSKVSMTRTVLTSQPQLKLQIANGLNGKRVLDGLALVKQLFR